MSVCVECLRGCGNDDAGSDSSSSSDVNTLWCGCDYSADDVENRLYLMPREIDVIHLLYDDKHLVPYKSVATKYLNRWKSVSLIELSNTCMNVDTITTCKDGSSSSTALPTAGACKLCVAKHLDTRLGHSLLIFYSLSLPMTNRVLVDLFVLWALSANQPHRILHWIKTITPIDVAFHFFYDCCTLDQRADENDDFVSTRFRQDKSLLMRYIYKAWLNGSIRQTRELTYIRDELLSLIGRSGGTVGSKSGSSGGGGGGGNLCSCNQMKPTVGEDLAKGRSYKAQNKLYLEKSVDGASARQNRELQAIQSKASSIMNRHMVLENMNCCVIGSNGKIYNNRDLIHRAHREDMKRLAVLDTAMAPIDTDIRELAQTGDCGDGGDGGDDGEDDDHVETVEDLLGAMAVEEDDDDDDDDTAGKRSRSRKKTPAAKREPPVIIVTNMFTLFDSPCKLCDKLVYKQQYHVLHTISETILNHRKVKLGQPVETIVMTLNADECNGFDKTDLCYHYTNHMCTLNELRYWQFYAVAGYNMERIKDQEIISHRIRTVAYSRNCTVCIEPFLAVLLKRVNISIAPGMLKLKRWVNDTLNRHMI